MIFLVDHANLHIHSIKMEDNLATPLQLKTVKRSVKYGAIGYMDDPDLTQYIGYLFDGRVIIHNYLPELKQDDPIIMVYKNVTNIAEFAFIFGEKQSKHDTHDFLAVKFYLLG